MVRLPVLRINPLVMRCDRLTVSNIIGQPCESPGSAQQIRYGNTNGGLVVLSDVQTVEVLAHFARERIPERSV